MHRACHDLVDEVAQIVRRREAIGISAGLLRSIDQNHDRGMIFEVGIEHVRDVAAGIARVLGRGNRRQLRLPGRMLTLMRPGLQPEDRQADLEHPGHGRARRREHLELAIANREHHAVSPPLPRNPREHLAYVDNR